MAIDVKIHQAQTAILRELLFRPQAGFAAMQKGTSLTSDHFNFHIARLVELGLVEKLARGQYHLTHKGKEYANKMDTDNNTIERQPKVAVCLMITRADGKQLVQQRLKQPFYGYWGRPTGKIRWGETILETAGRELMEETGLTADFVFDSIYHKMDYNKATGGLLEDKIFFVINATNTKGALIEEFEGGRNAWMTLAEYGAQPLSFENNNDGFKRRSEEVTVTITESAHEYAPEKY